MRFAHRTAHELEPWKISNLCFNFQVWPKFCFGPTFPGATCLPPVLAGGSTVKSSSPNKSWSSIPVNRGRDPSLADSESLRAVQQRLGRQSVPAWTPLAGSVSHQIRNQLAPSRSVSCRANMGILEILVDILTRTSDVMARAGGAAAAQDVRHQPDSEGTVLCRFYWLYTFINFR